MSIGVIEGVAEAANSILKVVAGRMSDRWNRRKPLVVFGYTLSSTVRPVMAVAGAWVQVLGLRFVDRLGKGIRGAPRDAMLARLATGANRGRVFGFHRGMDHAGAVAGPIAAALFLFFYPGEDRTLFALTVIPGIIVIVLVATLPRDEAAGGGDGVIGVTTEKRGQRGRNGVDSEAIQQSCPFHPPLTPFLRCFSVPSVPSVRSSHPVSGRSSGSSSSSRSATPATLFCSSV